MAYLTQVTTITIPLSGFVSDTLALRDATVSGIWFPVVTSGAMYLQGSPDTTSANFVRVQYTPPNSGDFQIFAAAGSLAVSLNPPVAPWPYVRLVSSIAQAAARTLYAITKVELS